MLKREHRCDESLFDNSFKIRLLSPSGPDALSVFSVSRIVLTS